MTAKRWEIINEEFISYTGGTAQLISNGECKIHLWENPKDAQLFCDKLNAINKENEQLKQQNQEYKNLLQDMGMLMSDNEVVSIRNEISDKFLKPLFESNGFDVDIDTTDGFTIIPKGDLE